MTGLAFLFVGVWILAASGSCGFGWAIFICAAFAIFLGIFGVYTVGYGSVMRVRIHSILFLIWILLHISILLAFLITYEAIYNSMLNTVDSRDTVKVRTFVPKNRWTIVICGIIGVCFESLAFILACAFHNQVAKNELEEMAEDDPVLDQRRLLAEQGLLPEQQERHTKTNAARAKLNEKYGGIFEKKPINTGPTPKISGAGGYRKV